MPEMDLKASLTFLIIAAITGALLFFWLTLILLLPGLVFIRIKDEKDTLVWFAGTMLLFLFYFAVFVYDRTLSTARWPYIISLVIPCLLTFLLGYFHTEKWVVF